MSSSYNHLRKNKKQKKCYLPHPMMTRSKSRKEMAKLPNDIFMNSESIQETGISKLQETIIRQPMPRIRPKIMSTSYSNLLINERPNISSVPILEQRGSIVFVRPYFYLDEMTMHFENSQVTEMYYPDDGQTCSISNLPNEILLLIFEQLDICERVVASNVCTRWSDLLFTHGKTLELIAKTSIVYRSESLWLIDFQPNLDGDISNINATCKMFDNLNLRRVDLGDMQLIEMHAWFSRLASHVRMLIICPWSFLFDWPMPHFKFMVNLTSLLVYDARLILSKNYWAGNRSDSEKALAELATFCPNLRTVAFISCKVDDEFNKSYLHKGFYKMQRFRLNNILIDHNFLDELLTEHPGLESIMFELTRGYGTNAGDKMLDVLEKRLRGRVISRISLIVREFEENRLNRFLATDIMKTAEVVDTEYTMISDYSYYSYFPCEILMANVPSC